MQESVLENSKVSEVDFVTKGSEEGTSKRDDDSTYCFIGDTIFDFYSKEPLNLEWMGQFLEMDEPHNLEWMSQFLEMDESWFNFA